MAKQKAHNHSLALNSPKQRQGSRFEAHACQFLMSQGLVLIAKNWQQPKMGELDLVMLETNQAWSTLVFVEVRQRLRSGFGDAALSVTKAKQRKIIKAAKCFLQQHPEYANCDCRFDVVAYNTTRSLAYTVETGMDGDHSKVHGNDSNSNKAGESVSPYQPEWLTGAFMASAW